MKKHCAAGGVAQRRRLEQAAEAAFLREITAHGPASAQVEISGIAVGGNCRIAWYAQGHQAKVGELGWSAARTGHIDMAFGAIALVRIVEQYVAAQFLRREGGIAGHGGIELAGV